MGKISLLFLLLFFGLSFSNAQSNKYLIYLTDKSNTPYSVSQPSNFLSQKSIDRRTKQGIAITNNDLPVNPNYVSQIDSIPGITTIYASKWLNAVLIEWDTVHSTALQDVENLSFVIDSSNTILKRVKPNNPKEFNVPNDEKLNIKTIDNVQTYGQSSSQNNMLGTQQMHLDGYTGSGILIAFFDAGFPNVDQHVALGHLRSNNRVKYTYDVVSKSSMVYNNHSHGTTVMGATIAYQANEIIGTAYNADVALFRTEDVGSEFMIEEFYWLIAAEKADSIGADIINSSLGYYDFDNPAQNYSISDLDGNTSIITKATDYAASKGMLVVVSAGNEGNSIKWSGKITMPADCDSCLAIGAVDANSNRISFSSKGPTANGRIKPDIVSQGSMVRTISHTSNNAYTFSSGTSLSAPLVTGLAAGLWEKYPNLSAMDLVSVLKDAGSLAQNPDTLLGYGIPTYLSASTIITGTSPLLSESITVRVLGNPVVGEAIRFEINCKDSCEEAKLSLFDMAGRKFKVETIRPNQQNSTVMEWNTDNLLPGTYFIRCDYKGKDQVHQVVVVGN